MAIVVTKQVLEDGGEYASVKLHLVSGAASDVTDQSLLDVSTLSGTPATVKIMRIDSGSSDMDIDLLWDADANVAIMMLPIGENIYECSRFGGLRNNAGTGITGDILFTTRGAAADTEATIFLDLKKS